MSKPLISVLILCYNYADLLSRALDACAKQIDYFSNFEVVLIDNASTDNTKSVFDEFNEKNPSISAKYVYIKNNKGPTNGWNIGLEYVSGDYVMFNDADDWMEPNCLYEISKEIIKSNYPDRVISCYQEVRPNGDVARVRHFKSSNIELPSPMLQGTAFKTSVIKEHNIRFLCDVKIPYDFGFTFDFVDCEESFSILEKTTYNYYYNPKSLTNEFQKEYSIDYLIDLIEITSNSINDSNNKFLNYQKEYLCLRTVYSEIVSLYIRNPNGNDISKKQYSEILDSLTNKLPLYRNNKLLFPLKNGYDLFSSSALYLMITFEKLNLLHLLLSIVSKIGIKKNLRIH